MSTRILIADDSQLIRERLVSILAESNDLEIVGQATNGAEALALKHELRPDVLLLDIWMPEMNGIEALEEIRQTDSTTFIVMLTNDASTQHRKRCLEAGANYFLHKSREFEKLPGVIEEIKGLMG